MLDDQRRFVYAILYVFTKVEDWTQMADRALEGHGFEDDEPTDVTKDRWVQAQRDLITTTLDYNLQTIASLIADGRIDLSPSFQRRERWDRTRQSRLIESFLMNVPLPPVFLNEDEYGQYSIIDGKQRMTAISEYLTDAFELQGLTVFQEANGQRFSDLDTSLQSVLQTRASLRAIILLRLSDPLIKYHVFQRLNTGGVRLNAQEVRNVTFAGAMNDLLVSLSQSDDFQKALGIDPKTPNKSALWREMRDVELVLRYFTLRNNWRDFRGSLGGAMNEFMADNLHPNQRELDSLASDFSETLRKAITAFGHGLFRRWSPRTSSFGRQPLATLFDAQMLAVMRIPEAALAARAADIQSQMVQQFVNPEFTSAIGSQTNTPAFLRRRVSIVSEMVLNAVASK
jgi:hypothetical protein